MLRPQLYSNCPNCRGRRFIRGARCDMCDGHGQMAVVDSLDQVTLTKEELCESMAKLKLELAQSTQFTTSD